MRPSISRAAASAIMAAAALLSPITAGADFALQDRQTVVFLGDSNTQNGEFARIVETYTLLRHPERKVRFKIRGVGGDTAEGGLARLESDVFDEEADVVIVIFGANEISWGFKPSDEAKQAYLAAISEIVSRSVEKGIEVYVSTYFPLRGNPYIEEEGFLHDMGLEAAALAFSLGGRGIDVGGRMFEVAKKIWDHNQEHPDEAVELHIDRAHLDKLGHRLAAYALLKELGAPSEVSKVRIDVADGSATSTGASVQKVAWDAESGTLRFERRDLGLPLALDFLTWTSTTRWIPMGPQLNQYWLTVANLPKGTYAPTVDGQSLEPLTAAQLAAGQNVGNWNPVPKRSAPGGPWRAESLGMKELTDARHAIDRARTVIADFRKSGADVDDFEARSRKIDRKIVELQRRLGEPSWYRVELRKVTEDAGEDLADPAS